jgi:hypothetical protein
MAKTADAYFWRGWANAWLSTSAKPSEPVLNDFHTALKLNYQLEEYAAALR